MATDVSKVRSQGQMLKELCEREEGANSKHGPGHSPTNPGGLYLGGPAGSRLTVGVGVEDSFSLQPQKAARRGLCKLRK